MSLRHQAQHPATSVLKQALLGSPNNILPVRAKHPVLHNNRTASRASRRGGMLGGRQQTKTTLLRYESRHEGCKQTVGRRCVVCVLCKRVSLYRKMATPYYLMVLQAASMRLEGSPFGNDQLARNGLLEAPLVARWKHRGRSLSPSKGGLANCRALAPLSTPPLSMPSLSTAIIHDIQMGSS